MKLKEAYRYQNKLSSLISSSDDYLSRKANITKITETHFKSKANSDVEDEVKDICERKIDISPNIVVDLIFDLIKEKNEVSEAISKAKRENKEDIDLLIEKNKNLQKLAHTYKSLANVKASEKMKESRAYKFNGEGNQVPYIYETKEVVSIDYNRDKVRKMQKKLETESNETSMLIESLQLSMEVNHTPKYDICDSFEDILEALV